MQKAQNLKCSLNQIVWIEEWPDIRNRPPSIRQLTGDTVCLISLILLITQISSDPSWGMHVDLENRSRRVKIIKLGEIGLPEGGGSLLIMWVQEACRPWKVGNKDLLCYWEWEAACFRHHTLWTWDTSLWEWLSALGLQVYLGERGSGELGQPSQLHQLRGSEP